MRHPSEEILQQVADGRESLDLETKTHIQGCTECQSTVDLYGLIRTAAAGSKEESNLLADHVMLKVYDLEAKRTEWKERAMLVFVGLSALLVTVYFTMVPGWTLPTEGLRDWSQNARESGELLFDNILSFIGGNVHFLLFSIAVLLAFEWIDRIFVRRVHSH